MATPELPGHNPAVAPGMTQVIESGQTYTLIDDKGDELELVGRDRPWVVEFLSAFDHMFDVSRTLNDSHPYVRQAQQSLKDVWDKMPADLRSEMPSYRAGGIQIGPHQH